MMHVLPFSVILALLTLFNSYKMIDQYVFLDACRNGDMPVVVKCLNQKNIDINLKDPSDGSTPLILAIRYGNDEIAQLLIHSKAIDMEIRDNLGRTPLLEAVHNGNSVLVGLCLKNGSDFLKEDKYGRNALSDPLVQAYADTFKAFLTKSTIILDLDEHKQKTFFSFLYDRSLYWNKIIACYSKFYKNNQQNTLRVILKKTISLKSVIQKNKKDLRKKSIPLSLEEFEFRKQCNAFRKKSNFSDVIFDFSDATTE